MKNPNLNNNDFHTKVCKSKLKFDSKRHARRYQQQYGQLLKLKGHTVVKLKLYRCGVCRQLHTARIK